MSKDLQMLDRSNEAPLETRIIVIGLVDAGDGGSEISSIAWRTPQPTRQNPVITGEIGRLRLGISLSVPGEAMISIDVKQRKSHI
jgi:hypothetical protein